jgi:hypothetical protein
VSSLRADEGGVEDSTEASQLEVHRLLVALPLLALAEKLCPPRQSRAAQDIGRLAGQTDR